MLAFARQDQLQSGPVALPEVLQGLATLLHGPLGADIRLEIEAPAELPPVRADRMQLELVLFNLALNARDAMPQGGTLRLDAAGEALATANPQGLPAGSYVWIRVADSGGAWMPPHWRGRPSPSSRPRRWGRAAGLAFRWRMASPRNPAARCGSRARSARARW
jgi:C4-dicarboxylate-specific signal transduction histidine kinase